MADSVPVRCPACRRAHLFTPRTYPCSCGAPLSVAVRRGEASAETGRRSGTDAWVSVRCPACGRSHDWPRPELGCDCGAVIRPAVERGAAPAGPEPAASRPERGAPAPQGPEQAVPVARPAFEPVTIRTARDVLTAAGRYLGWLGYRRVAPTGDRSGTGADLRAGGLLARVDPSTRATSAREVETLWLACLHQDAAGAYFSLAGYTAGARERAERFGLPLFIMDLAGTPRPANTAADALIRSAPGHGSERPGTA